MTSKLGTFVGSRLRDARIARGLTASLLAERVGVSAGAVSQYEVRNSEPRPATLGRIAEVLDLPEAYFVRPIFGRDEAPHLYRSRAAATKRARESAEVRHAWLREIVHAVSSYVELPIASLPDIAPPSDPVVFSNEDIEVVAGEIRKAWKLGAGPIPNVVELLEAMGCVVSAFAFGAPELSAFSQCALDKPYVVLNADETACARRRFNAAHELGHLILHRNVSAVDAAKPEVHKELERQAHRFAGALLFPASSFADEVYSIALDNLVQVKARWRVSLQMMIRRAYDLEIISSDRYERTFRELSRRGYRTREPLDDVLVVESPSLLANSITLMLDESAVTREDLLHTLPFSRSDIEILAGLRRGYLSETSWGQVAELKLKDRPRSPSRVEGGRVLAFPSRPEAGSKVRTNKPLQED